MRPFSRAPLPATGSRETSTVTILALDRRAGRSGERQESGPGLADIDKGSVEAAIDLQHAAEETVAHQAFAARGELPGALQAAGIVDKCQAQRAPLGGDEQSPHRRKPSPCSMAPVSNSGRPTTLL